MRLEKEDAVRLLVTWRHQNKNSGTSFMVYEVPATIEHQQDFFMALAARAALKDFSPVIRPYSIQVKVNENNAMSVYVTMDPLDFVANLKQTILQWKAKI